MAMLGFFFAGITDVGDFNFKCQLHTCQGVVAIDVHVKATDFHHRYLYLALLGLQVQNLAGTDLSNTLEPF